MEVSANEWLVAQERPLFSTHWRLSTLLCAYGGTTTAAAWCVLHRVEGRDDRQQAKVKGMSELWVHSTVVHTRAPPHPEVALVQIARATQFRENATYTHSVRRVRWRAAVNKQRSPHVHGASSDSVNTCTY